MNEIRRSIVVEWDVGGSIGEIHDRPSSIDQPAFSILKGYQVG
jgi:hypothetical protein